MSEKRTILERLSNRLYAIPAVAQLWSRLAARRTNDLADVSGAIPFTVASKPLAQARLALITTGGIHLRTQPPFDMDDPDGDAGYREIPADVNLADLTITHKYYDHRDADQDPNIIFPLDHLRRLVDQGIVGSLAPRHFAFMGHIDGPKIAILTARSAPEVAAKLRADQVNYALLTPA